MVSFFAGASILTASRCLCAECEDLDRLPERLQGIPGAVQLKMPLEKKRRQRKSAAKSKT